LSCRGPGLGGSARRGGAPHGGSDPLLLRCRRPGRRPRPQVGRYLPEVPPRRDGGASQHPPHITAGDRGNSFKAPQMLSICFVSDDFFPVHVCWTPDSVPTAFTPSFRRLGTLGDPATRPPSSAGGGSGRVSRSSSRGALCGWRRGGSTSSATSRAPAPRPTGAAAGRGGGRALRCLQSRLCRPSIPLSTHMLLDRSLHRVNGNVAPAPFLLTVDLAQPVEPGRVHALGCCRETGACDCRLSNVS